MLRTSDYRRIEVADVYRQGIFVGNLRRTDEGTEFCYCQEFLANSPFGNEGVSWTMPPTTAPYFGRGESLPPFFANLAPEGARLAATIGALHAAPDDLMTVLLAVGRDCIGDVQIVPEGQGIGEEISGNPIDLEDCDLWEVFSEAVGGERLDPHALSGVQEKAAGSVVSFPSEVGFGNSPTIIKISPKAYPHLVENESFFLNVAAAAGLAVNEHKIIRDKVGRTGLVVKRFDRAIIKKSLVRLHQEDMCQLLGQYPWNKYRVKIKDVVQAIQEHATSPKREILALIGLYLFSYLIGNADLHAKNISLYRRQESNTIELTPGYDLLSPAPFQGLDTRMALPLDGRGDSFIPRNFIEFADRFDVPLPAYESLVNKMVAAIEKAIADIDSLPFDQKQRDRLKDVIKSRLSPFLNTSG